MTSHISILWFRRDLRLGDNPALCRAAERGPVLPVYILDPAHAAGAAGQVWLHHSLQQLDQSLHGALHCYQGDPIAILTRLASDTGAGRVCWNRTWEPAQDQQDAALRAQLEQAGIETCDGDGALLWAPPSITKKDGTPYRVFTPYFRKGCMPMEPREPLPTPTFALAPAQPDRLGPGTLKLLPEQHWHRDVIGHWQPGEAGARARLSAFVDNGLQGYREGRNLPALTNVSRLSPHLHFGEISPHTAWHAVSAAGAVQGLEQDMDCFRSELGWREFCHYLLHHTPDLPERNLNARFDHFPWRRQADASFAAWKRGQTGYPVVDAGMRELWQTGYMHNRVRMIVGSFLVKNLLLHWKLGAGWFEHCLFDADLANNRASWQWIAGCGADAAPYFRIFNPVTQGQKFDPDGRYVRRFIPEIAALPDQYLHAPWEAPAALLRDSGIVPGREYPEPVVELKYSRQRALEAFASLKTVN